MNNFEGHVSFLGHLMTKSLVWDLKFWEEPLEDK